MHRNKDRAACMSDLRRYFKKSDLLGGLTKNELEELRANIGLHNFVGEDGLYEPVPITYEALLRKVNNLEVGVGSIYVITDFQTIYPSNVPGEVWGRKGSANVSPTYNLTVRGIGKGSIDTRAFIEGKDWHIEYDIRKEVLSGGYGTKGKITYLRDSNGNSAYYDFKNIKFRRTKKELGKVFEDIKLGLEPDFYTFSNIDSKGNILEASELSAVTKHNEFKQGCWDNVFLGTTFNNVFEANCRQNTFTLGCEDSHLLWDTIDNQFHEKVLFTTGAIQYREFRTKEKTLSSPLSKTIHRLEYDGNIEFILTFLDPITYSHQVKVIKERRE